MATIRSKVEGAVAAYLETLSLSASVFPGLNSEVKDAPCVIARLASATEEPLKSGNYICVVEIHIVSVAEDEAAHEALTTAVTDGIWRDDLADQIEANGSGLTVFGAAAPHRIEYDVADDCWIETHTVELHCCPYTFPA